MWEVVLGYTTRYELSWEPYSQEVESGVALHIENHSHMTYALLSDGCTRQKCKWYSHMEDLVVLSRKFPGTTFHLSGKGEDAGDIWDVYALDGKIQKHTAKVMRVERPDPEAWRIR